MLPRRKTKQIKVGNVAIGGGSKISVQTMTKTDTADAVATQREIHLLAQEGCDIVRLAVPNEESANAMPLICATSPIPIIADIHFDHKLALKSLEAGVKGLRLNPGNLRNPKRVTEVVREAKARGVPIRIGVNAGSIAMEYRRKIEAGEMTLPEAMVESALVHIRILEDNDFDMIKVSLKASDVINTVEAYRMLGKKCDYPFHVGITEAGTTKAGTIKSAAGIGILLGEGLCDTIRVSLTDSSVEELYVGHTLLKAFGLEEQGYDLISCPTCGRLEIDMVPLAHEVEKILDKEKLSIKVTVMGCVVNGPGESMDADIGISGGKGMGLIYRGGDIVRRVKEAELLEAFCAELEVVKQEIASGVFHAASQREPHVS
ncbi:MAG: flavodoxin-dependent (E)-4-hydroxy-3-methylbut-2-enyl-diphosphate synthase [bacterium]